MYLKMMRNSLSFLAFIKKTFFVLLCVCVCISEILNEGMELFILGNQKCIEGKGLFCSVKILACS